MTPTSRIAKPPRQKEALDVESNPGYREVLEQNDDRLATESLEATLLVAQADRGHELGDSVEHAVAYVGRERFANSGARPQPHGSPRRHRQFQALVLCPGTGFSGANYRSAL